VKALGRVRFGLAGQRGGVVGDAMAVQTGGVGADLRPEGAAEEPGDRLAERLTFEVPERDVDRRDGGDRPALSPVVAERGVQVLPEHGVLECVLSDEARGVDLVDERPVDRRRAVRLTESGEAVLGEDLDDERLTDGVPAFRGAEHLGLGQLVAKDPGADFADLHGRLRRLP